MNKVLVNLCLGCIDTQILVEYKNKVFRVTINQYSKFCIEMIAIKFRLIQLEVETK